MTKTYDATGTGTSGQIQYFTAGVAGTYAITAAGAQGGKGYGSTGGAGGLGATASGDLYLAQGAKLEIVVGQQGAGGNFSGHSGGGGGGGSFVIETYNGSTAVDIDEIIAGGGGGGGTNSGGGDSGGDGTTHGSGAVGSGGRYGGGGGGGFTGGAGTSAGNATGGPGSNNAKTFAGGSGAPSGGGGGGFGGGGGAGHTAGGGGGGYGGGDGGSNVYGGGGGGSYVNTTMGPNPVMNATQTPGSNHGHTGNGFVKIALVCFAGGTRIRTMRGGAAADVAVEHLAVGDLVVTASGALRPIRWLGHRGVDCRRHPCPQGAMPVRIAAHAFGANQPARDLLVSPGHAIRLELCGEVLVPAIGLVNGATIAQVDVDTITYWHVELDSHDIVLAENLATESYLDCGNRGFFAEADVVALAAAPDAPAAGPADYCRPFHAADSAFAAVARAQLRLRAEELGWRLVAPAAPDDFWLEVDGVRVTPVRDGLIARAVLPAAAHEVFLCSSVAVPAHTTGAADRRRLGLPLAGLVIDDGRGCRREIGCADPRLADGFYKAESTHRWSNGRARLPAAMWAGVAADFSLRLALTGPVRPRWVAPSVEARDARAA